MRRTAVLFVIAGLLLAFAPPGAASAENAAADFSSFMEALQQLEEADRAQGIVTLVRSSAPMLGTDATALDWAEYGFRYMENVGEYRKDVTVFGASGFLDIGITENKVSSVQYYLSEHAREFSMDEVGLLESAIAEFGSPDSIRMRIPSKKDTRHWGDDQQ